ncbi:heat-labile enterotoxin alpha chain [Leptospira weilii str. 2006001853]|uniref:Heat-labile enterotoxin alpha chain n=1 Tax=Leptospira weilii str. 2006001853 TaxID=1001589 RepID=A0A828Z1W3_9LEPT|nr:enterotoxin A family protein [Leptospira weilii]EKR63978.1 heat-labile enterotoxin alpha chain [Leptospira weilii str. 2006001853]
MQKILMILIVSFLLGTLKNLYANRERPLPDPVNIVEGAHENQVATPPAEVFYLATALTPEQVSASDGFWSAGASIDSTNIDFSLLNHVTPRVNSERSGYISLFRNFIHALISAQSNISGDYYIYQIAGGFNIVDVQGSLGPYTPSNSTAESVALNRIYWNQVYGWTRFSSNFNFSLDDPGLFEHNPIFDRETFANATSSPGLPELAGFPQGDPRWGNEFFVHVAGCDAPLRRLNNGRCYLKQAFLDTAQKISNVSRKKSKIPILPPFKTLISQAASSNGTFVSLSDYVGGLCYVTSKSKMECRPILNNGKLGFVAETTMSDTGYEDSYMFADINNDRKDDFCRLVVGTDKYPLLKCNLGNGEGNFPTEVNFGSVDGGWSSGGAANKRMIVKGISGRSFFCRIIDGYEIACTELVQKRNGSEVIFTLGQSGITKGKHYYFNLAKQFSIFTDSNQDGVPDWCRITNQRYDKFDLNCWWSLGNQQFSNHVQITDLMGNSNSDVIASIRIMNPLIQDFCYLPKNQLKSSVRCYNFPSQKQYESSTGFNYVTRLMEAKGLMRKDGYSLCATEVRNPGKTMRLSCVSKGSAKSNLGFTPVFSTVDFEDYHNILNEKQTKIVYSNGRSLFCTIGANDVKCIPLNQDGPTCQRVVEAHTRSVKTLKSGLTGLENFQGKNECLALNNKDRCFNKNGICYKWGY